MKSLNDTTIFDNVKARFLKTFPDWQATMLAIVCMMIRVKLPIEKFIEICENLEDELKTWGRLTDELEKVPILFLTILNNRYCFFVFEDCRSRVYDTENKVHVHDVPLNYRLDSFVLTNYVGMALRMAEGENENGHAEGD